MIINKITPLKTKSSVPCNISESDYKMVDSSEIESNCPPPPQPPK